MVKLDNKNSSSVREFEQWVRSELHGTNKQPSHEQPATDQWSHSYDGDRYHIRAAGNDDCVAHADKLKDAERIINDHNQHQQCATQLQYLGNRAEELSSLLAGMTTERDRLQRQNTQLKESIQDVAIRSLRYCEEKYDHDDQARLNLEALLEALSDAEQEERSDAS